MANILSNALGSVGRFVSNDIIHPIQRAVAPKTPQQQQASPVYELGHFLANTVGQAQAAKGAVEARLAQAPSAIAHTITSIPNIRLPALEQQYNDLHPGQTSAPITLGGLSHHVPILSQAEKFAQQNNGQGGSVGQFAKGIAKTGAQTAPYVAPEVGFAKVAPEAGLALRAGAKALNNFIPGAVTGVGAQLATGNRNPASIAENALASGVGNAAGTLGAHAAGKVVKAVAGEAKAGFPNTLANESGKIALPSSSEPAGKLPAANVGKSTAKTLRAPSVASTQPKVAANKFTTSVQNSPEVSPEVQKQVAGQHEVRNTKALVESVNQEIKSQGLDKATSDVQTRLSVPDGQASDTTLAKAIEVAKQQDALGTTEGHDSASSLYDQIAQHGTAKGQGAQVLSILSSRTPEGQLYGAQKMFKNAGVPLTDELKSQLSAAVDKIRKAPPDSNERAFATQDLHKLVSSNIPSNKWDKAFTLFRTGLLTGPQTVTKVALSHGVLNAAEQAKDIPATAIDKIVSLFSGQRSTALTLRGRTSGAKEGAIAAGRLLRTGHDTPGTGGFSDTAVGALAHPEVNYGKGPVGRMLNFYTQKVGQLHAALPKAFYKSAQQNDLVKQAMAAAKTSKVERGNLDNFINEAVSHATAEMKTEADTAAKQANFQQSNVLTESAAKLRSTPDTKWVMPFTHIASAILSDVGDWSPIGVFKAGFTALKENGAKGWTPTVQKHFVEELGRSITGSSAMATGYLLYKAGVMTLGYPTNNPKEVALWKASGKQENSILLNGQWRQLTSLGPFATVLAAGGYAAQSGQTNGKGVGEAPAALFGAIKNIGGQSYLSGLSGLTNAISNPQQSVGTEIKSLGTSVIPTGVGTIARAFDPQQRVADNLGQAIESKIPGLRETLTPQTDAFGNVLPRQGGVATNLLDPTRPQANVTNPVINELNRLDAQGIGATPTPVKTISVGGKSIKLTPAQQEAHATQVGPQIQQTMQQVIQTPGYQSLSDTNKGVALTSAASDLNEVQKVRTLVSIGNTAAAQAAYKGLSANQKAMFNGQPSVKNYTALTATGTSAAPTAATDPRAAYQQKLATFQQQSAAGLLTQVQQYTQSLALGKENITSQYSPEVTQFYALSTAQQNELLDANPALAPIAQQASVMDQQLAQKGFIAKPKMASASGGSTKKTSAATLATLKALATPKVAKIPKTKSLAIGKSSKIKVTKVKSAKLGKPKAPSRTLTLVA